MKARAIIWFFALATLAHAEDWTTTDGVTYKNVQVIDHDTKVVNVKHDGGSASIPLAKLTWDIRSKYGYDASGGLGNPHSTKESIFASSLDPAHTSSVTTTPDPRSKEVKEMDGRLASLAKDIDVAKKDLAFESSGSTHGGGQEHYAELKTQFADLLAERDSLEAQNEGKAAGEKPTCKFTVPNPAFRNAPSNSQDSLISSGSKDGGL